MPWILLPNGRATRGHILFIPTGQNRPANVCDTGCIRDWTFRNNDLGFVLSHIPFGTYRSGMSCHVYDMRWNVLLLKPYETLHNISSKFVPFFMAISSINHKLGSYYYRKIPHISYVKGGFFLFFYVRYIQHCFICRPSDSTVSEDAGIEPRTVATTALAVRRSYHSSTLG